MDAVKKGNYFMADCHLKLGYWDQMNQSERASVMQEASEGASKSKGQADVYALLQYTVKNGYESFYFSEEVDLSSEPYEFVGKLLDHRVKALFQKIEDHEYDPSANRFPLIDNTLDRLGLFEQFYTKPQSSPH